MRYVLDIMENSEGFTEKLESSTPLLRSTDVKAIDERFIYHAEVRVQKEGIKNTLFIVNTGHSIPIGVHLHTKYGMQLIWNQKTISTFDPTNLSRILSQIRTYPLSKSRDQTSSSFVVLIDCHERSDLESFPSLDYLKSNSITKVIYMDEAEVGPRDISGCGFEKLLKSYKEEGKIEVKRFGIDPRIFSDSILITVPERPVYKNGPVEKLGDEYYAQNWYGVRYLYENGEYTKIVNGFGKLMTPEEIDEFDTAISDFKKSRGFKEEGKIEVKSVGIDPTIVSDSPMSLYKKRNTPLSFQPIPPKPVYENKPVYKEGPVQKLGDEYYAKNCDGKRYLYKYGEYKKIVGDFKKSMTPEEIDEFDTAISDFKKSWGFIF